MATGFVWQGHKTKSFWIPIIANFESAVPAEHALINLEGRTFSPADLPSRCDFKLKCHNAPFLAAITAVAFASVLFSMFGSRRLLAPPDDSSSYYELLVLCYFVGVLFLPALTWLFERSLMRAPGITMATIQSHEPQAVWVKYQFTIRRAATAGVQQCAWVNPIATT